MSTALPESTYRLQFHAGFTFRDAAEIVPYLHALGVTHCYASPYFKARPGSTHGYDVIDHCSLNPELGTQADFDAWIDAMSSHGMSHILDIVPNHVGVGTSDNVWWNDVLEHGPASKYAKYFDIAWRGSPQAELQDKVLLPSLGDRYDSLLERGELKVVREDGKFWVRYYERRFPVSPESAAGLKPGELDSLNRDERRLDELIRRQHYVLAYWRRASEEINYRRFFDINDLAALAMERREVFDATHALTFKLIDEGKVAGLRIDHPDGLFDPEQYLCRLRERVPGLYVVVEKILAPDEPLPGEWPVNGTSGYDFLNVINGLFVCTANADAFSAAYREWAGNEKTFAEIAYESKKRILETSLASELQMLTRRLEELTSHDLSHDDLRAALREVIACFPVYRSYITDRGVHPSDVAHVETAVASAIARNPQTAPSVYRAIADAVLHNPQFAAKFQQLTASVTAKGVEDTAFYIYNRFVSLNEVGGEPSRFGVEPEELHAYLADRQAKWPYALSALSTHDTKRSEDVRARLNVLSEMPGEWTKGGNRWAALNARHRVGNSPDRSEEYLLYQTLIGAWPLEPWTAQEYDAFVKRIQAYMVKAMREAKVNTSWTDVNETHENAVASFVAKILDETTGGEFLADLRPLRQRVSQIGLLNSISQTVLRLTAPGVPDTYQGTELWDFSLVDPDNRRLVDYEKRIAMLGELPERPTLARELLDTMQDGRIKMYVTSQLLRTRREHPGLFSGGRYLPLRPKGKQAEHVFAFARESEAKQAVVIIPRLIAGLLGTSEKLPLGQIWRDTSIVLPDEVDRGEFRDVFTGRSTRLAGVPISDLLTTFPAAVFVRN